MNCAVHNQVPAVAYCRTCGKPVCEQCKRDVRGVVYCEDCLASRVEGTLPPGVAAAVPPGAVSAAGTRTGGPNPTVAFLLGFIPGVGAIYNGQIIKALIHVIVFAGLCWAQERSGGNVFFGLMIAFLFFYMVWDAYATAKAIQENRPLPDPFGLGTHLPASEMNRPAYPGPGSEIVPPATQVVGRPGPPIPTAAIVLIGLGVLFLLDNIGVLRWHWMGHLWPIILIVIGVWLFARRSGRLP
ncbi:MAG: B-box zinc finger protein [Terriglobales bacterium]